MKGKGFWIVIALIAIILLGKVNGSNNHYEETLKSGLDKYYKGQEMSKSEYNAVKDYNDWKFKSEDHTYDRWSGK